MRERAFDFSGMREPGGPVTCAVCGCRLTEAAGVDGAAWRHFQVGPETDARGCRPRCLEDLHDRHGDVLRVTELSLPFAGEGSAAA
ncbi:MAG TPA: hypothetical protein VFK38_00370 [Candidatus Limnocylindrales bacterium]|nr:hypothetical protein [Candidatus Limnocylindrales bacterium]